MKSLFLFVVMVGYIFSFTAASNAGTQYSAQRFLLGISLGIIYLILGFFEPEISRRFLSNLGSALFFSIEITLVFSIGWIPNPGGTWLI